MKFEAKDKGSDVKCVLKFDDEKMKYGGEIEP